MPRIETIDHSIRELLEDGVSAAGIAGAGPGGADARRTEEHVLPATARVEDGRLIYDGGQLELPVEGKLRSPISATGS